MRTRSFDYNDDGAHYTFTVKEEFFDKCPTPHLYTKEALNENFHLNTYLHSVEGPAALSITFMKCSYWIDGHKFKNEEEWTKAAEIKKFENRIDNLIND